MGRGWRHLLERLSKLGSTDGRNVKIEYRWAGGDVRQITEFAANLCSERLM